MKLKNITFWKMENVPKDVLLEILLKLKVRDVLAISLSGNKYNVMNNENFWRKKLLRDGYNDLLDEYFTSQKEKYKQAYTYHRLHRERMNTCLQEINKHLMGNENKWYKQSEEDCASVNYRDVYRPACDFWHDEYDIRNIWTDLRVDADIQLPLNYFNDDPRQGGRVLNDYKFL